MNENKSFLVIDTLKNCVDCPLTDSYCMLWRDCDYENVIHKDCLFKQLPSKEEVMAVIIRMYEGDYEDYSEWMGDSPSTILTTTADEQQEGEFDLLVNLVNTIYGDNK